METIENIPATLLNNVPKEWNIGRVDEYFDIQQGKQVSKKNRIGKNQQLFLRTKNVFWGKFDLLKIDQMHFTQTEERRLQLQLNDLLFCEGGAVGRTALWKNQIGRCYYQNHLHRLRSLNGSIRPDFALYWFWYAFEFGNIYFGRDNVTTIPNMSKSRLGELPLPCPPKIEQICIASILSTIQRAIEQQERLVALTTELKKSLMHKLFTEGIRGEPQKETEIGLVPESWNVLTVQDLVDKGIIDKPIDGNHGSIHPKATDYCDVGIPFVMAADLMDGTIDLDNCKRISKEQADSLQKGFSFPGDVLISHKATIGETAIVPEVEFYAMLTPQVTYYRVRDERRLNNEYLKCFFDSHLFQIPFLTIAKDGSTRKYIGITRQRSLIVACPGLDEQIEIKDAVGAITRKTAILKYRAKALHDLFRTLLHQLMTAQIRVNDIDLSELGLEEDVA